MSKQPRQQVARYGAWDLLTHDVAVNVKCTLACDIWLGEMSGDPVLGSGTTCPSPST